MTPFGYFMTLISFVYAVALGHMLNGAARMVRHRRELRFSWPHALWMATVFLSLLVNWVSFWDANALKVIDLFSMTMWVVTATANYLVAALVTPEFERPEDYDLVRFHERQAPTYLTALLVMVLLAIAQNAAGVLEGLGWSQQNRLVAAMAAPPLAAIFGRHRLVQLAAPLAEMGLMIGFAVAFYPKIA
jgi:hypothetical protein